ncbi:hypothetical protein [Desertimonas flava]|uniref:hypothetical protein n=1 Tax=Desertimonas flava TaxID=2064846 RepID=UPI000E34CFE3|nr:hypothetical protein [Desertimonas flava]
MTLDPALDSARRRIDCPLDRIVAELDEMIDLYGEHEACRAWREASAERAASCELAHSFATAGDAPDPDPTRVHGFPRPVLS